MLFTTFVLVMRQLSFLWIIIVDIRAILIILTKINIFKSKGNDYFENQGDQDGKLLQDEENPFFQHDGASPHYDMPVQICLNERFPENSSVKGAIDWSAGSPYLTPLTQPEDIPRLRRRIVEECEWITSEFFFSLVVHWKLIQDRTTGDWYYGLRIPGTYFINNCIK